MGCQNNINPSESLESEQSGMEVLTCTNGNGNGDGCTLTPGYWKTHSKYGPASYDDTWAEILELGEDTDFFGSDQSYYDVLWTPPKKGNAYYILAHAYIAAELNSLNGADLSAVQADFNQATVLFDANDPWDVVGLNREERTEWIDLADILDDYNNGITGPGHCL